MDAESESLLMRRMDFFHEHDIEIWLKKEVRVNLVFFLISTTRDIWSLRVFLCAGFIDRYEQENSDIWWWLNPVLWPNPYFNRMQV